MLSDFFSLFYPEVCSACGNHLIKQENQICTYCTFHLPKTNFHLREENPLNKIFWGKVDIQSCSSLYYFTKGGKVQRLMHQLKYKGNKELGVTLGKIYASDLKVWEGMGTYDVVVPVPLHKAKLKKRGYNQSEYFAKGLGEGLNLPVDSSTLIRQYESETQTKKAKFSRWQNVEKIFSITNPEQLKEKKVLLVDDVLTTGSTLEACASTLLTVPGVKVGIATIAYSV